MHPKSRDDFKILLEELESWRIKEVNKIKSNPVLSEEEKQDALIAILNKVPF